MRSTDVDPPIFSRNSSFLSSTLRTLVDEKLLLSLTAGYNTFYSETGLDEPATTVVS